MLTLSQLLLLLLGGLHQSDALNSSLQETDRKRLVVARIDHQEDGEDGWKPDRSGLLVRSKQRLPQGYPGRRDEGAYVLLVLGSSDDVFSELDAVSITCREQHNVCDTVDNLARFVASIVDASMEPSNEPEEEHVVEEPHTPASTVLSESGTDEKPEADEEESDDEHDVSVFRPTTWQRHAKGRRSTIFLRSRHDLPENGQRKQISPLPTRKSGKRAAGGASRARPSKRVRHQEPPASSPEPVPEIVVAADASDTLEDANDGMDTQEDLLPSMEERQPDGDTAEQSQPHAFTFASPAAAGPTSDEDTDRMLQQQPDASDTEASAALPAAVEKVRKPRQGLKAKKGQDVGTGASGEEDEGKTVELSAAQEFDLDRLRTHLGEKGVKNFKRTRKGYLLPDGTFYSSLDIAEAFGKSARHWRKIMALLDKEVSCSV